MHAANVASLIETFDDPSDGSAIKSLELIRMLLECSPDPYSRAQFTPGHITCTGLVLAADGERMLMVHHRRLNRWLLPGGHVESDDAEIWDAAHREVVEETGADQQRLYAFLHDLGQDPRDQERSLRDVEGILHAECTFRLGIETIAAEDRLDAG